MHTGENEQGLRKVVDLTRWISIALLLLHFYYECYGAFRAWELRSEITDNLLRNVARTGLFYPFYKAKVAALFFLALSLLGTKTKKSEKAGYRKPAVYLLFGLLLYFLAGVSLLLQGGLITLALVYIITTSTGFILILTGGTMLSSIIRQKLSGSVFNTEKRNLSPRGAAPTK